MNTMAPTVLDHKTGVSSDSRQSEGVGSMRPVSNEILPLEAGDHLSRAEFERRYKAMPHVKKAELVEGVVFMPSPARHQQHARPNAIAVGWLLAYAAGTPGTDFTDNGTLRLDYDNEVQPDAALFILEERGGRCRNTPDDYLEGPPELIVEIAASSASNDMHSKLQVYRRNGVQEYLVFLTLEQEVVWFCLDDGEYRLLSADDQGAFRSRAFPGLWLQAQHVWDGNLAGLMDTLQQGLASQEHADFAAKLAQRAP